MSDSDNFFGDGVDFLDGYGEDQELDENGNPIKKPGDLSGEEEVGDEEAGEYPPSKPAEKPIDEESIPESLYKEKSPELFKEKRESILSPDEGKEFAKQQYPSSPLLAGEEEKLQNFVEVLSLTGVPILQQRGYPDLRDCLAKCQPCRDLQDGEIKDQDLSGIVINGSRFRNGLLEKVSFEKSTLWDSDFSSCELINVNFDNSDLRGSSFRDCDLSTCSFVGVNLSRCNFVGTILPPADQMRGANLSGIIRTEREEKLAAQPGIFPA